MYVLCVFSCFRSDCFPQDKEYDNWDVIADYIFQVIPIPVSSSSHSTFSIEAFECYIRPDAAPGSRGDSCGRLYRLSEFFSLILWQMGDTSDISSLLAKYKPRIVVDEDGGELLGLLFAWPCLIFSVAGIVCGEILLSQAAVMGPLLNESRDKNCMLSFLLLQRYGALITLLTTNSLR